MSGPKVVRIVTREEMITTCRGELAQLDSAVSEWRRVCDREGITKPGEVEAILRRQTEIHALLSIDKFADLQNQVPREIEFLRHDLQVRMEKAAADAARERSARRRLAVAATSILGSLAETEIAVPEELRRALREGASGAADKIEVVERAIARALPFLVPDTPGAQLTDRQREIAAELSEGESVPRFVDWVANKVDGDDEVSRRLDQYIAELEIQVGREAAAPFSERAGAIARETSPARRQLLADSLVMELASNARERREWTQLLQKLRALASQLDTMDTRRAARLRQQIDEAEKAGNLETAEALVVQASDQINTTLQAGMAAARRKVILEALSSLGYEVREGMKTAWVEKGHVTLRKAASPDYGVELGGAVDAERLQFRAVAFGSASQARDGVRDRDAETGWCSDFGKLKEIVSKAGGSVSVEKALPVGAVPLKVIEDAGAEDSRYAEAPVLKPRTFE